jgi:hypothetical protein
LRHGSHLPGNLLYGSMMTLTETRGRDCARILRAIAEYFHETLHDIQARHCVRFRRGIARDSGDEQPGILSRHCLGLRRGVASLLRGVVSDFGDALPRTFQRHSGRFRREFSEDLGGDGICQSFGLPRPSFCRCRWRLSLERGQPDFLLMPGRGRQVS